MSEALPTGRVAVLEHLGEELLRWAQAHQDAVSVFLPNCQEWHRRGNVEVNAIIDDEWNGTEVVRQFKGGGLLCDATTHFFGLPSKLLNHRCFIGSPGPPVTWWMNKRRL
jgi:hypothetical protein